MKYTLCNPRGGCRCIEVCDIKDVPDWAVENNGETIYIHDTEYPGVAVVLKINEKELMKANISVIAKKLQMEMGKILEAVESMKREKNV